jgi:phosphomannomutase
VRPSGTEPKVKLYAGTSRPSFSHLDVVITKCDVHLHGLLDSMKKILM